MQMNAKEAVWNQLREARESIESAESPEDERPAEQQSRNESREKQVTEHTGECQERNYVYCGLRRNGGKGRGKQEDRSDARGLGVYHKYWRQHQSPYS